MSPNNLKFLLIFIYLNLYYTTKPLKEKHVIFKNLIKIVSALIIILGLISCCTKRPIGNYDILSYNNLPHKSSVYIEMIPSIYEYEKTFEDSMYEAYQSMNTVSASGVFVNYKNETHILTVSHFCEDKQRMLEETFFNEQTDVVTINIFTTDGEIKEMEIVKSDKRNDLCLLKFVCKCEEDCNWQELSVAKRLPRIGQKVYTISRPYGIYSVGSSLVFDGRYGGYADEIYDFQLVPAAPGSSGSPIINQKGELIGITSMAMFPYHEVVLAVNLKEIRGFLGLK